MSFIETEKRTLQWRYNGRDSVSNHQPRDCLLNLLFRRRSRKHQSSASLAFVRGIHRGPVNSPHKWPVTRKMFPFDDVIMNKDDSADSFHHADFQTWYMIFVDISCFKNWNPNLYFFSMQIFSSHRFQTWYMIFVHISCFKNWNLNMDSFFSVMILLWFHPLRYSFIINPITQPQVLGNLLFKYFVIAVSS